MSITHAQPLPKRPTPALANCSLNASKLPNDELIASAMAPVGAPPACGAMICQNIEWFAWPPPLLRTAVRMSSGTVLMCANQILDALRLQIGMLLERGIQVVDVGLMMLAVMNLHRLLVDVRFERVGRVRKRRKRVSHRTSSLSSDPLRTILSEVERIYEMESMRSSATFVQCFWSAGTTMRLWTSPATRPSSIQSR